MAAEMTMPQQAVALVRRTRAGDQNAWATIYRIGEEARKGQPRARQAFELIKRFIERSPAAEYTLGAETAVVMDTPAGSVADPEASKPMLPKGSLSQILDTDVTARVIANAWKYKNGMPGAAVALAAGPPLVEPLVARDRPQGIPGHAEQAHVPLRRAVLQR